MSACGRLAVSLLSPLVASLCSSTTLNCGLSVCTVVYGSSHLSRICEHRYRPIYWRYSKGLTLFFVQYDLVIQSVPSNSTGAMQSHRRYPKGVAEGPLLYFVLYRYIYWKVGPFCAAPGIQCRHGPAGHSSSE